MAMGLFGAETAGRNPMKVCNVMKRTDRVDREKIYPLAEMSKTKRQRLKMRRKRLDLRERENIPPAVFETEIPWKQIFLKHLRTA